MPDPVCWSARSFLGTVTLSGGMWTEDFPIEALAGRVKFYEGMVERYGRQSYRDILVALKSVA